MVLRRRVRNLLVCAVLTVVGAALAVSVVTRRTSYIRDQVVSSLNARFLSQVDLDSLAVDAFPTPSIAGGGLRLRHNGRTDVEPLISIASFSASAGAWALAFSPPLRLQHVELDGLDIRIPPGGLTGDPPRAERRVPVATPPSTIEPPRRRWNPFRKHEGDDPLTIARISAVRATVEITPRDITKLPRIFEIHDLEMRDFGGAAPAPFTASLENPKPAGRIETTGAFGPWAPDEPRLTPVVGQYVFKDADLGTINGIGGILFSEGRYTGVLERIEVDGTADVPDFRIDIAGTPVPLTTSFKAIVDGTNGNTYLERVEGRLGDTPITTSGAVVRARDVKGRHIALDIAIVRGRIEDILRLVVKSPTPILTGRIDLTSKMLIPAGELSVVEKLQLDGSFELARATFTNVNIQKRIAQLSETGRGAGEGEEGKSVVSNLTGRFLLRNAVLRFQSLTFRVPGATIRLAGTYDLRSEQMDFAGDLLTDASLAEMTSGFKSLLARLAQPLFRREGGGARLPIRVSGPRTKPSFGIDVKRALLPG